MVAESLVRSALLEGCDMALDPYASCPCGSGKKYRWCCQPIDRELHRAYEQEANGQHDTALRIIDEVIAAHSGNPQGYGQKAELLYKLGRAEEAEAALEKAFALNANYPYGLLLRAFFRFQEGEIPGALLLARRAAEVYDPQAHDFLAQIFGLIFECELALNRLVAAREALRRAVQYAPADEQLRERFEAIFGDNSRLPLAARRDYRSVGPPPPADPARRAAWTRALGSFESGRLGELAEALQQLTTETPKDNAGWFYLGLARAWLGDNVKALEALDRHLEGESDDERASTSAALQEVLRCGHGLESVGDYSEHVFLHQFRDVTRVEGLLQEWVRSRRLVPMQSGKEGTFLGLLLEMTATGLITVGGPPSDTAQFAGYLLVAGNVLRVSSPLKEPFDRLKDEVRQRLGLGLTELKEGQGPIQFHDVVAEALVFPASGDEKQAEDRVRQQVERHYEEVWPNKPRKALAGNSPLDAAGHTVLRRKLLGVIRFIEDCAGGGMVATYDFNRLRRKLGLTADATNRAVAAAAAGIAAATDIAEMGAPELGGLNPESLDAAQLEQAWQAAQKLDASELALRFAKALAARPADPARPDRYPVFNYLTQRALQEGDTAGALDRVNEGEKADCEQNEGRRRNDYELRRGQVLVKRGEADAAHEVFQRLIDRTPAEMRFRTAATEAMLSLRQGARALAFAEAGLQAAQKQNDRDSAGHLQELAAAARKQSS
jgi:tetratricopeptide (TPR) repeat protein